MTRQSLHRVVFPVLCSWVCLSGCSREEVVSPPPPPVVTVAQPVQREITDYDDYTGRIAAIESVDIRPRVSGFLDEICFKDGEIVKKGEVLFRIDPRPYQADVDRDKAEVVKYEALLRQAESELTRIETMRKSDSASQVELDQAQAKRDAMRGSVDSAKASLERAELDLNYATIIAPITGQVSRPLVTVGNLVNSSMSTNNVLTTIVSVDPVYVYFDVDENSLLRYQMAADPARRSMGIRSGTIPVYVGLANEKGTPHEGVLDFADNRVDAGTGTISVRGRLSNKDNLLTPGLFARVQVRVSAPYRALLVPEKALGSEQGQAYVTVIDAANKADRRYVQPGTSMDGLRVIRSGLNADDWVVVNGLQRARPGVTVEPKRELLLSTRPAGAATQP